MWLREGNLLHGLELPVVTSLGTDTVSRHSEGGAMNQQDHAADTEPRPARPPRTAFVTGATGFLGLNLVGQLGEAGWEVVALHRPQSDLKYLQRFPVRRAVAALRIRMPEPSNLLEGAHRQQPVKML